MYNKLLVHLSIPSTISMQVGSLFPTILWRYQLLAESWNMSIFILWSQIGVPKWDVSLDQRSHFHHEEQDFAVLWLTNRHKLRGTYVLKFVPNIVCGDITFSLIWLTGDDWLLIFLSVLWLMIFTWHFLQLNVCGDITI